MRPALAAVSVLFLSAAAPAENNVPLALQQRVIAHYSHLFIMPQTAIWEFESARPYLLGGTIVCGHVNYQNSERRYVGASAFYLVLTDTGTGDGDVLPAKAVQDPTGTIRSTYLQVCKPPR
jgi:hypothetical protein